MRNHRVPRLLACLAVLAAWLCAALPASASQLIARDASDVTLEVNDNGMALVTYRDSKGTHRVLAWGAVDEEVEFKLDYSGGWGTFRKAVWKNFRNTAESYDGPPLAWLVGAVQAPDGTYWALQSWRRMLPNLGYRPWKREQRAWELRLSHWSGEAPKLEIWLDWVYGRHFHHLFGRYTYKGKPVYGFDATRTGVPLDPYGRNIYLDTRNSAYGSGWKRENSFLTHRPNGNFCYGFYPHRSYYDSSRRPAGHGERYRATVIGPGVTPDAYWEDDGLGDFDALVEKQMNALSDQISAGDRQCKKH